MIFEVKCDERTKNEERTNGPDAHTYCLFYSIRYVFRVKFVGCKYQLSAPQSKEKRPLSMVWVMPHQSANSALSSRGRWCVHAQCTE